MAPLLSAALSFAGHAHVLLGLRVGSRVHPTPQNCVEAWQFATAMPLSLKVKKVSKGDELKRAERVYDQTELATTNSQTFRSGLHGEGDRET